VAGHDDPPSEGRTAAPGQASARSTRFANLVELERVDSTNRYAAAAVRAGADDGLVVVAGEQTAGRGRRGRSWLAPPGGALLCSVVVRPRLELGSLQLVGAALGLAARDAVRQRTGAAAALKWPNDVLVGEKKLAGILAELAESPDRPGPVIVVGIGLNCTFPPGWGDDVVTEDGRPLTEVATTIEAESGVALLPDALLASLLVAFEGWLARLEDPRGTAAFVAAYREACETVGRLVEVTTPTRRVVGRATAIASDGRLEVATPAGPLLIDAGDVVHLRNSA
jgi:BirA family biotin operon repressor/biotin-[acetyl-CoA-carboxylase] ligase